MRRICLAANPRQQSQLVTTPTRAFLYYLRRYLETRPERKAKLRALHKKITGAELHREPLWRHMNLKKEPLASAFLVYLTFLHHEHAIEPNGKNAMFVYSFPELLHAKKK